MCFNGRHTNYQPSARKVKLRDWLFFFNHVWQCRPVNLKLFMHLPDYTYIYMHTWLNFGILIGTLAKTDNLFRHNFRQNQTKIEWVWAVVCATKKKEGFVVASKSKKSNSKVNEWKKVGNPTATRYFIYSLQQSSCKARCSSVLLKKSATPREKHTHDMLIKMCVQFGHLFLCWKTAAAKLLSVALSPKTNSLTIEHNVAKWLHL